MLANLANLLGNLGALWALWFVAALVVGGALVARDERRLRRARRTPPTVVYREVSHAEATRTTPRT